MEKVAADRWCNCPDRPLYAHGPTTLLDHPGECEFPDGICTRREHRVTVHQTCGCELVIRFCGCGAAAFTFDPERGWWVHNECGWPTRQWFEAAGKPAPENLLGMRPVTYHEFAVVPSSPRSAYERLDERQRVINREHAGSWVWD